jgi:hypothetical protein
VFVLPKKFSASLLKGSSPIIEKKSNLIFFFMFCMTLSQYTDLKILDKVCDVGLIMNIQFLGLWEMLYVNELCDLTNVKKSLHLSKCSAIYTHTHVSWIHHPFNDSLNMVL